MAGKRHLRKCACDHVRDFKQGIYGVVPEAIIFLRNWEYIAFLRRILYDNSI